MTLSRHEAGRSAAVSCRTEVCYRFGRKHGRDRAVKRRDFIALIGGAAAWPLAARAQQQPTMPVVGILGGHTSAEWTPFISAFNVGSLQ